MSGSVQVNQDAYDLDGWSLWCEGSGKKGLTLCLGQSFMIYGLHWQPRQGWTFELTDCAVAHVDRKLLDEDARVACALELVVPTPGPPVHLGSEALTLERARLEVSAPKLELRLDLTGAGDLQRTVWLREDGSWRASGAAVEVELGFRVYGKDAGARWRAI